MSIYFEIGGDLLGDVEMLWGEMRSDVVRSRVGLFEVCWEDYVDVEWMVGELVGVADHCVYFFG